MRILYVADLHYALKQYDWLLAKAAGYDLVAIGGDLLNLALAADLEIDVQVVVIEKYLKRLMAQTPVLLVSSGNHDGDHRLATNESICRWLREVKTGSLYVDGDAVEVGDTLFTICPWWDGDETRTEIEQILARDAERAKSRWVWIHHAPPDQRPVSWSGRQFGGDEYLGGWIERYQPDFVLSGHIHNAPFTKGGSWFDHLGKTWVFNPGRQDGPAPSFLDLDLNRMYVEWMSLAGLETLELN